jgi:hypothetical protein
MKKHSKKLISKGWMRLHIILSLIPTAVSFLLAAVTDEYWNETGWFINLHPHTDDILSSPSAGMELPNGGIIITETPFLSYELAYEVAFFTSICSFVLYWIVVALILWIKKGFKK